MFQYSKLGKKHPVALNCPIIRIVSILFWAGKGGRFLQRVLRERIWMVREGSGGGTGLTEVVIVYRMSQDCERRNLKELGTVYIVNAVHSSSEG